MTTEALPRPKAVDGVVYVDAGARALWVRLPDNADSHTRSLWRAAHQALVSAQQAGWRTRFHGPPELYAHTDRRRDIAHGESAEMATLKFTFPARPESAWSELVGKPRLIAIVTIDQSAAHFLGVRFLHRPGA